MTTRAPAACEPLLARGNGKVGEGVLTFSIPEGETCPGATPFCLRLCYGRRGHYLSGRVQGRLSRNLERTRRADFAQRMAAEVRRRRPAFVRVHAVGDFYDAAYADKWAAAAAACPRTDFYWYSRSWREPAVLPRLVALAALPNVWGWWSEDRDTGPSPPAAGVRVAFLVRDPADEPLVDPARHDLVFRDAHHRSVALHPGPVKRINRVMVCPYEQWWRWRPDMAPRRREPPRFTCSTCRICLTAPLRATARCAPGGVESRDNRGGSR